MSRIDVISADKGKFKIMVNFIQWGAALSSAAIANREAQSFHDSERPTFDLNLVKEDN